MELCKFPVTAPDGTEYRVKIEEWRESLIGPCLSAVLYVPRKRWGFRRIHTLTLYSHRQEYDPNDVEYVAVAHAAVADYYRSIEVAAIWAQKESEAAARKQAAVDRFNAWDGRIETEVGA
jgi:hypothetical protein